MKNSIYRLLLCLVFLTAACGLCSATTYNSDASKMSSRYSSEVLNYEIRYKWGLIVKHAGTVDISIVRRGDRYYTRLTGRTDPWADRFYKVRDTLSGIMEVETLRPYFYEKIAREGSSYKHDEVKFEYKNDVITGYCLRRVFKDNKQVKNEKRTLQASHRTVDMLSSFFYMRTIPFQNWTKGQKETMTIFSGKRKETLTFKYHGTEKVKVGKNSFNCYHISFIFTSEGGKKSSDDMDAWITTDDRRIPVKLQGNLTIGKVQCFYTGK